MAKEQDLCVFFFKLLTGDYMEELHSICSPWRAERSWPSGTMAVLKHTLALSEKHFLIAQSLYRPSRSSITTAEIPFWKNFKSTLR